MKTAILMMQKNETELLDKWVVYHSYQVGFENLYVYDNGSTNSEVVNKLKTFEKLGLNVIWHFNTKNDFGNKGSIFKEAINKLEALELYDFFIPLDCDEFIAVSDKEGNISCDKSALIEVLDNCKGRDELLLIEGQLYNSSISEHWFNKQPYRKCFFYKDTIKDLDLGFHWGKVKNSESELRTRLVQFHFHNKPYSVGKAHAKEKLIGRVDNFSLDCLSKYNGAGLHLIRFFTQSEDVYIKQQVKLKHRKSKVLANKFNELDITWPYLDELKQSGNELNVDSDISFKNITKGFDGSIDNIKSIDGHFVIEGWGVLNNSQPVLNIKLKLNGVITNSFEITKRFMRSDVDSMLNIKGVKIGFQAKVKHSQLQNIRTDNNTFEFLSFIDSCIEYKKFNFNKNYINFFNKMENDS